MGGNRELEGTRAGRGQKPQGQQATMRPEQEGPSARAREETETVMPYMY